MSRRRKLLAKQKSAAIAPKPTEKSADDINDDAPLVFAEEE